MNKELMTGEYLKSVGDHYRYIYDGTNKERYKIEDLFYLQRFSEGEYAFINGVTRVREREIENILKKFKPQELVEENDALVDDTIIECDLLRDENCMPYKGKLVLGHAEDSRIVLFANAGYGKSTLLKRIAVAYAMDDESVQKKNLEFIGTIEQYGRKGKVVPVVVILKNHLDELYDIEQLICESVREICPDMNKNTVKDWMCYERDNLMIMLDGLDEIPVEKKSHFLEGINEYLRKYKETRMILTTRISGISDEYSYEMLKGMNFRGRSIMPFTRHQINEFCKQWVDVTEADESVIDFVEKIHGDDRLMYLREFTYKPLELAILLKYFPNQNVMALDRWRLFENVLWYEVGNHLAYEDRRASFNDICTLLGFIAYHIQKNDRNYISFSEIEEVVPLIKRLDFFTDLFGVVNSREPLGVEHVWKELEFIAQNIGIVDVVEAGTEKHIAFPVRSYQEYFAAYAVCNLVLSDSHLMPEPTEILKPYMTNPNWRGVVGFVIAGLDHSLDSIKIYEEYVDTVYTTIENISDLKDLLSINNRIPEETVKHMCEKFFAQLTDKDDNILLLKECLSSVSSYVFKQQLIKLFKQSYENGESDFLEAVALIYFFDCIDQNIYPMKKSTELLDSAELVDHVIGAGIVMIHNRVVWQEVPIKLWLVPMPDGDYQEIAGILYQDALKTGNFIFVQAIAELCACKMSIVSSHGEYLDSKMHRTAINSTDLSKMLAVISSIVSSYDKYLDSKMLGIAMTYMDEVCAQSGIDWHSLDSEFPEEVNHIKSIIYTIGMFPFNVSPLKKDAPMSDNVASCLKWFFDRAKVDKNIDIIAILVCAYHMDGRVKDPIKKWIKDFCDWEIPESEKRLTSRSRERNHCYLMMLLYLDESE